MLLLEVIVCDEREAKLAVAGGAGRLELVAARCDGGLTPPPAIVDRVVRAVSVPVHATVRPHARSFLYDAAEREDILATAAAFAGLGVSGLVFGALDERRNLDAALLTSLEARRRGCRSRFIAPSMRRATFAACITASPSSPSCSGY